MSTHVNSKGKILPTRKKKSPQRRIEPMTLHQAGQQGQHTTNRTIPTPFSASELQHQVFLGWPRFLLPCGLRVRAPHVVQVTGSWRMCLIHLHCLWKISSAGCCCMVHTGSVTEASLYDIMIFITVWQFGHLLWSHILAIIYKATYWPSSIKPHTGHLLQSHTLAICVCLCSQHSPSMTWSL